jgi:hypothetical protein
VMCVPKDTRAYFRLLYALVLYSYCSFDCYVLP